MPKQILLVEDSVTMQKVVEITFAHEDYQISAARDADEALVRLRDLTPDVILCDAGLPGRSGYELCAAAKDGAATRDVPVLLLTSNFSPYDEARGQRAGVDGHLVKPFETQALIDKVTELLRRKASGAVQGASTLVSMPLGAQPIAAPSGAGPGEGRRPTIPPMPPPRAPLQPPPPAYAPPPQDPRQPVEAGVQRSTLMGIPAVNPLGPSGLRPPPPPGMRVRETGNLPAINPPQGTPPVPATTPAATMPSWSSRPSAETGRPSTAPAAPQTGSPYMTAPPPASTVFGVQSPVAAAPAAGIPHNVPQMPRLPLLPRAPVPAPVLAALERIAARGAEYEAIAKLSMEAIEQIVWEVVPDLAEAMIRAELDRLVKEREAKASP